MKNTDTEKTNQLTSVKTIYARAAVLLLALNFCLTGYCFLKMNSIMEDRLDSASQSSTPSASTTTLSASGKTEQGDPTNTRESN